MRIKLLDGCSFGVTLAVAVACGNGGGGGFGGDAGMMTADGGDDGSSSGCPGTQVRCGSTCVDTNSDASNCGACGQACGAGDKCCGGGCATSCSFVLTGVDASHVYQNGGAFITLHGTGFQSGMRVTIGDGRAPVWVLDPATARVEAPPAPVGNYDVTIALGGQTSMRTKAVTYAAGNLLTPWQQKPMSSVRGEGPGVAVMQDGRVLVTGGTTTPDDPSTSLATADIFDRKDDSTHPVASSMSTPRWRNSAVTLLDGRVLVVGGACGEMLANCLGDATKADLFDPTTDTFSPTASPLNKPRVETHAVLLPDGRVLVASANDPSLEVFDPATGKFTLVPSTQPHPLGFVVRMRDGRVLLGAGGAWDDPNTPYTGTVEVFDPDAMTFSPVGTLSTPRAWTTAHVLPDGRAIVIAGAGGYWCNPALASVEVVDAKATSVTASPIKLATPRCWHASALVRDGTILVLGGYVDNNCTSVSSVERIDPVAGTVMPFASLPDVNVELNAVTLLDGSVLGVGGGVCGTTKALPDLDFLPADPKAN